MASVSRQLHALGGQMLGLCGQVHGLRNDVDNINERQKTLAEDVAALRKRLVDDAVLAAAGIAIADAGEPKATPPRPSLAVQAAKSTGRLGKYGLMALGALGLAAQVAAVYRPGMVAPIETLIQLLQMLGGQR